MKSKDDIFKTLEMILIFYDNLRFCCKMTEDDARKKTLDAYHDFVDWLNEG